MHEGRLIHSIQDGHVVIFSDAHYWPNVFTPAHRAVLYFCDLFKPDLIIANGDILDGARISKHARIGWQNAPKLVAELRTCENRLREIEQAVPEARRIWTLGNHDARFETWLANHAPEFSGVPGFTLKEHFPKWEPCWSLQINDDTIIKHRWKGGPQATRQNVIASGMNIFTGHLHSLRVSPYSDYRGTRFGVDTGTLAEPYGPQFQHYTEDNPVDWRSGFVIATWQNGKLLWPEIVQVVGEGQVSFRGEILYV